MWTVLLSGWSAESVPCAQQLSQYLQYGFSYRTEEEGSWRLSGCQLHCQQQVGGHFLLRLTHCANSFQTLMLTRQQCHWQRIHFTPFLCLSIKAWACPWEKSDWKKCIWIFKMSVCWLSGAIKQLWVTRWPPSSTTTTQRNPSLPRAPTRNPPSSRFIMTLKDCTALWTNLRQKSSK